MTHRASPSPPQPPAPSARAAARVAAWLRNHKHPLVVSAGLLLWTLALYAPAVFSPVTELPGPAESDVIRGAWGLNHVARALPDPIHTARVYFPAGVRVLPLPFASAVLLAPVNWLLGPFLGYTASTCLLLTATGLALAFLTREVTGSWPIGSLAGATLMAQPMLQHAVSDGTPEHLALWGLPLALACAWRAARSGRWSYAILTGLITATVALDSPYAAVYGMVLAPFFLLALLFATPLSISRRAALGRLLVSALVALPGLLGVALLYSKFSLAPQDYTPQAAAVELAGNSVDLKAWWNLENRPEGDIYGNLTPALLPTLYLLPMLLLALAGLPRSLPWLLAGTLMLVLALGTNRENPGVLGWWLQAALGQPGAALGQHLGTMFHALNQQLSELQPFSGIRFPRRWLVPTAMSFSIAGSIGLARLAGWGLGQLRRRLSAQSRGGEPLTLVGVGASLLVASALVATQPYLDSATTTSFPQVSFARWIAERPTEGAAIIFPTIRPGPPNTHRMELPVFANISDALRSVDCLYFQLVHQRPIHCCPSLFTLSKREGMAKDAARLIRDTNDLALPGMADKDPPPSATDEAGEADRAMGRKWLYKKGLRWVALDMGVYGEQWTEKAASFYEPLAERRVFDDGDGVLVLELAPEP